ncbi:MAG: hypothetical protein IJ646_11745 [Clostridia bacterium]|nr:hypothetical protein [Clostridia bacterium]
MGELWTLLTANVPELILLLVGLGLLVFEMYIPGFGVPGVLGIVTMALGFILLRPTLQQGILLLVILAAALCVALVVLLLTASKGRIGRSKLVLNDVALKDADASDLSAYLGKRGVTRTALRPAGIADFDGVRLNVVSDGEFIAQGARVKVMNVAGNRIVVAEAADNE